MPRSTPDTGPNGPRAHARPARRTSYPELPYQGNTTPDADWPSAAKLYACAVPAALWPAWTDMPLGVALGADRQEGGSR